MTDYFAGLDKTRESSLLNVVEPEQSISKPPANDKKLRQRNVANLSNLVLVVATLILVSEVILAWPR